MAGDSAICRPSVGRGRKRAALITALMVVASAATLALPPRARATVADGTRGRFAGMNIQDALQPNVPQSADLARIKGLGINTVAFEVWTAVRDRYDSNPIAVPGITAADQDLATAMQQARAQGLRTTLTIKLFLANPYNEWRGYYTPSSPPAFFASYGRQVEHYATLAQQQGASILFIGSELDQAQKYSDGWRAMAALARRHFKGLVSYEANHPTLSRGNQVAFWDALDLIGVSAYFPLSAAERPTRAQLKAGWRSYGGRDAFAILETTADRYRKQIVFGEAGYSATTYVGREPWSMKKYDFAPDLQAAAYQALLETFENQPWWAGVLWWVWDRARVDDSPIDKPAERLLQQWYADGMRPGDAGFVAGGTDSRTSGVRVPSLLRHPPAEAAAAARDRHDEGARTSGATRDTRLVAMVPGSTAAVGGSRPPSARLALSDNVDVVTPSVVDAVAGRDVRPQRVSVTRRQAARGVGVGLLAVALLLVSMRTRGAA
jgi:hypothetical protein